MKRHHPSPTIAGGDKAESGAASVVKNYLTTAGTPPIPAEKFRRSSLLPGDAILYFSADFVDWTIALKTWTKVAHIEIYAGGGISVASRNGLGVNRYCFRETDIAAVRRPISRVDLESANDWFERRARGQKYDWIGLLCFTLAVKRGSLDRMFCSEFATRFYRHGFLQAFDAAWDADRVPPSFFLVSPMFETIWQDGDLF